MKYLILIGIVLLCSLAGCSRAQPWVNIQWDDDGVGFIRTNVEPVQGGFDI